MKYNNNYLTSASLFTMLGSSSLDLRVTNIETGKVVARTSASGSGLTIPDAHKSAIDSIKAKLAELNINGVILPGVTQIKEGETVVVSPSKPGADSLISSDLSVVTPSNILENEIDKLSTASNIPTGETVLSKEADKASPNLTATVNIKPSMIEQPSPTGVEPVANSTASTNPTAIEIKPIEVLIKPTDATSGKVTDAAMNKDQVAPSGATTVNNTSITNSLPTNSATVASNSSATSSNLLIDSSRNIMESIRSLSKNLNKNDSTVNNSSLNKTDLTNSVVNNSNLLESATSLTKNSLIDVANNSTKSKADSSNLSTLESSILSTLNGPSAVADNPIDSVTNNLTQVKSSKLVESSNVKKILAPDKTLEKSVTSLSKSLPEAVNNLSNSVTSISPQTNSSTSVMTEGTKIDQSSRTTINNPSSGNMSSTDSTDAKQQAIAPGINNDYYLQAIYSALMSGKIKVTLGYQ